MPGHVFSTPLLPLPEQERLRTACSQLPWEQRPCPQPATNPCAETRPLPLCSLAFGRVSALAAEASHQPEWRMARESMQSGTRRAEAGPGARSLAQEGRSLRRQQPLALKGFQTRHTHQTGFTDRLMGSILPSSQAGSQELVNLGTGTTCYVVP